MPVFVGALDPDLKSKCHATGAVAALTASTL